jgi:hypothetical protein
LVDPSSLQVVVTTVVTPTVVVTTVVVTTVVVVTIVVVSIIVVVIVVVTIIIVVTNVVVTTVVVTAIVVVVTTVVVTDDRPVPPAGRLPRVCRPQPVFEPRREEACGDPEPAGSEISLLSFLFVLGYPY